jgi:glycosyltransferase involved in cell wall biosynthesis
VVDDGSTDGTALWVERLDRSDVVLVRHGTNRGYGAAVRSGLAAAQMPWILLTDADRQFDLQELGRLTGLARHADLVLGWRITRQDPLGRRVAGWVWNRLVAGVLRLRVRDVDCAFKLVRRRVVQDLDLRSDGATISAELLLRSAEAGARIEQVGVHHRARTRGRASGGDPRVAWRALRELAALRRGS